MSSPRLSCLAAVLGLLALSAPARAAGGKEAQAQKSIKQALDEDYLNTRFDAAEQKLRAALQGCARACSKATIAKLHVALGSVLAGGKKELEDARDEFVEALTLDPKIEPNPDLLSTEVSFAYEQARKRLKLASGKPAVEPPKPPKKSPKPEAKEETDEPEKDEGAPPVKAGSSPKPRPEKEQADKDEGEDKPKPVEPPKEPANKNWFTLSFAPDIALVSGSNVCTLDSQGGGHYVCLRPDGSRYQGAPTLNNGDNINGGLTLATMRVMLGYDRLVHPNITVGLRAGFAFNGASGPGVSFLPVHGEARLGIWPGHDPFVGKGVRPMIILSGGVAQVDAKVNVQVLEDGTKCGAANPNDTNSPCMTKSNKVDDQIEQRQQTLSAYKQNGLGFAAATVGVQFAPSTRVALHLAARGSVTFPALTAVISPEVGLSVGF